jgi:integrase
VRPLLPGGRTCLVLIASRDPLSGLVAAVGADPLRLDVLDPQEARELLIARLGADRVKAEPDAIDENVDRCVGLPLALAIVAANAAVHPGRPLATLAAQLRRSRERLDTLSTGEPATDMRAVFSWSYHALSEAAARVFRMLGSPVMVWTPEQTGLFLDRIQHDRLYPLIQLIAYRGLRRGEACGVRWGRPEQDRQLPDHLRATGTTRMDRRSRRAEERRGRPNHRPRHGHPRRPGSVAQAPDRRTSRLGGRWIHSGRIFTREDGRELHPADVTKHFNALVEANALPPVGLHDLRHGAATVALEAGVDIKVVQEEHRTLHQRPDPRHLHQRFTAPRPRSGRPDSCRRPPRRQRGKLGDSGTDVLPSFSQSPKKISGASSN